MAALDAHLLWTVAVILLLALLASPVFLVLTARAYARLSPDEVRLTRWQPRAAGFGRTFAAAFLPATRYAAVLALLTIVSGFAFDEWDIPASLAPSALTIFATAEFWIGWQLSRWERRHGFGLFREVGIRFGHAAERLVKAPLGPAEEQR